MTGNQEGQAAKSEENGEAAGTEGNPSSADAASSQPVKVEREGCKHCRVDHVSTGDKSQCTGKLLHLPQQALSLLSVTCSMLAGVKCSQSAH